MAYIPPIWIFRGRTVVRSTPSVGAPLLEEGRAVIDHVSCGETAEDCIVRLRDCRRGRVSFELPLPSFLEHWKLEVDYFHHSSVQFVRTSHAGPSPEDAPDRS
jgi:hypothetical protein